jgi:DNA-3-methyladenine glycosylase II
LTIRGGAYLTPNEMEALTEGWKPYRSLGVYYTWAIADGGTA